MFLHSKKDNSLVKVLNPEELIDPLKSEILGQAQAGQEEQDQEKFAKEDLIFPSGETLPRCWVDADYRMKN